MANGNTHKRGDVQDLTALCYQNICSVDPDPKVRILAAYKSDHNPIALTFINFSQNRGKGFLKFDN